MRRFGVLTDIVSSVMAMFAVHSEESIHEMYRREAIHRARAERVMCEAVEVHFKMGK